MIGSVKRALAMPKARARVAAVGVAGAALLGGGLYAAAPASAATCSASGGVEVWEWSNYGNPCYMFTSPTTDTRFARYSDGNLVYDYAGTAENNYWFAVTLYYDINYGGAHQDFPAGPYSANLNFQGVGTVQFH